MKKTNSLIQYLAADKKRIILFICAIILLLIIMLYSSGGTESKDEALALDEYKVSLEEELASLCSSIYGVGNCRVEVMFSEGESYKYQSSKLVAVTPPKVMGVVVICDGADSISVVADVTSCISALFDVGTNRICVLKKGK